MNNKKTFNKKYKKMIEEYIKLMSEQKFDEIDGVVKKIRKLQDKWKKHQ